MTNEEFLRDVCPNHTDKSQWNKSELLHILELQKEQLRLHIVSQQRELLLAFAEWKEYNGKWQSHENQVKNFLKEYKANNCG